MIALMLQGLKSGRCDAADLRTWCRAGFVQFYVLLAQLIEADVVRKIPRWVRLEDGTLVRLPQYMLTAKGRSIVRGEA